MQPLNNRTTWPGWIGPPEIAAGLPWVGDALGIGVSGTLGYKGWSV
jgi:hypothetical protein